MFDRRFGDPQGCELSTTRAEGEGGGVKHHPQHLDMSRNYEPKYNSIMLYGGFGRSSPHIGESESMIENIYVDTVVKFSNEN